LFAVVEHGMNWSRAQLVDQLKNDAKKRKLPKCTYGIRSTQYWEAEPNEGKRSRKLRPYRREHVHQWFTEQLTQLGKTTDFAAELAAIAPPTSNARVPSYDCVTPTMPASGIIVPAAESSMDGSASNLAEGAWPLHQTLEKPYSEVAQTVQNALDRGNLDVAFPEFRRSLFYSGYHEKWALRRRLTAKLLKARLGPLDAAWVYLKALSYMEMELGNFPRAKAAISEALTLYRRGECDHGIGLCFRYLGDLYSKFGDVAQAIENKVESLKHLKGVPETESQLELSLLRLQHLTEPSEQKFRRLFELGEQFREIRSWRYWLTELERGKTLRDLGNRVDGLVVLAHVEFAFRTEITMERTRKLAVRLIEDLKERPATL
jgi:tetratricopeptide (TPR) repeat protein